MRGNNDIAGFSSPRALFRPISPTSMPSSGSRRACSWFKKQPAGPESRTALTGGGEGKRPGRRTRPQRLPEPRVAPTYFTMTTS